MALLYVGLNLKHITQPNTSFNSETTVKKDILVSLQAGYEYDLNPYNRGSLPSNSYLYLYGSFSNQGSKSRVDLYQQAIIENFSLGLKLRDSAVLPPRDSYSFLNLSCQALE